MSDDIAIAHWGEHCNGGGERVGWDLARVFDEPLYVGRKDESIEPDDVDVRELFDGWFKRGIQRGGLTQMASYGLGWQRDVDELNAADTVVTSGNEPLFWVPDGQTAWVAYVHHTGRHQTDLLDERWGTGIRDRFAQVVMWGQRLIMSNNSSKPDLVVANSEPVKRRINRYWGVPLDDIRVVYPPVDVEDFSRTDAEQAPDEEYYLALSRLDWHKRIGEVIDAFNGSDRRLLVAGTGSEQEQLEDRAEDNIEFLGYVSEERKRELFAGARAVITNALAEDFGLTTVEPMAAGTPVIGVREGMTQNLVQDGYTGYTYERGDLLSAVERFEDDGLDWDAKRIELFADRFNGERFAREMRAVVDEAREKRETEMTPEWATEEPEQRPTLKTDGGPE